MADRSHLTRTPITDSRGRQTVVYRRPETVAPSRTQWATPAARPAVVVQQEEWAVPGEGGLLRTAGAAQSRAAAAETYAERLARIKGANEWRAFEPGTEFEDEAKQTVALLRQWIAWEAARSGKDDDWPEGESLEGTLDEYAADWPRLAAVGRFLNIYSAFADGGDYDPEDTSPELTPRAEWDQFVRVPRASAVFEMYAHLHDLDLIDATAVPEGEDAGRFAAHLYARANPSIDYDGVEFDHTEHVRLLDEHYRRAEQIVEWVQDEMPLPQIRALLEGEVPRGLSSGAL